MAQTLTIENDTHWKTQDIRRIVRAAMNEAEADVKQPRHVNVEWQPKGSRVSYRFVGHTDTDGPTITISLPRKGPARLHHNALIALAAAGIDTDTPMLAVSDSYFLANALAFEFAEEQRLKHGELEKSLDLKPYKRSTDPPGWADCTKLVITKYADPMKDGTFVEYERKKALEIASAEMRIDKHQASVAQAQRLLTRAKRDKKKAQDALSAAKKRRMLN